jgi:elongation factor Tu
MIGTKFDYTKPFLRIGTLGHRAHGKTTLTAAILQRQASKGSAIPTTFDEVNAAGKEVSAGAKFTVAWHNYETDNRLYGHLDCPDHADFVKSLLAGVPGMDAGVLVVSAESGVEAQTHAQVQLARALAIADIVVFVNKADRIQDEDRMRRVELDVRDLLSAHGYAGADAPITRGSAQQALENPTDDRANACIDQLVEAMDAWIPQPRRALDRPFLMPIEFCHENNFGRLGVQGRIEQGMVSVGDEVDIVGYRETSRATVTGIDWARRSLDEGQAGDNVTCILRASDTAVLERGQVLAEPETIGCYARFAALVYFMTQSEGGREEPLLDGHHSQLHLRAAKVEGVVQLASGTDMLTPGDWAEVTIDLMKPVAMGKGLHFSMGESARTVGIGVVTQMVDPGD